ALAWDPNDPAAAALCSTEDVPQSAEPASCNATDEIFGTDTGQTQSVDPNFAGPQADLGPVFDSPDGIQTVDPTQIDARSLTNAELLEQALQARQMLESFNDCGPEWEAWTQLQREIEDDRQRRIGIGFVFLAAAKNETPVDLITLQPGPAGSTAVVIADPAMALGTSDVTLSGPIMTIRQFDAYLRSSSMMQVDGEQAEQAIAIIQSGKMEHLRQVFRPEEPAPQDELWQLMANTPIASGTAYGRNRLVTDLSMYDARFLMPDTDAARAVGHFGELQSQIDARALFGLRVTDLNKQRWTNMAGVETVGSFPAFDLRYSDAPFWDLKAEQNRFASVAAGDLDYLVYKYARLVDVYGRRTPAAPTVDAAVQHVQEMSGITGLQPGTPEFYAAERRYLPTKMVAVPQADLAAMRATLMDPGGTATGNTRRTIMRQYYQDIYKAALAQAPIEIKRGGTVAFTINSLEDLASRAPAQRRASGETYNPLQTLREGVAWKRGTDRLTGPEYDAAMQELGRLAAARLVSADSANELRRSADFMHGTDLPGSTAAKTEIWETRSADADTIARRFAGVLDPSLAKPGDTPMTRVTNPSASEANAHLSALRALGPDATITRSSPNFQAINAELIRNGLLNMPKGQRQQLIERIMTAGPSNVLELEIQQAILADNAGVDMRQFLQRTTGEFNLTSRQIRGGADYLTYLQKNYPGQEELHFNADRLTYFQEPGVRGVAGRSPGAAGRGLFGSLVGYGVTAGLDKATGRPVQSLSFGQLARDTGISVASEETERLIGAYLVSKVPISSSLARGVVGKAAPGFIVQPIVSLASEGYALHEDAKRYLVTDEEYRSRMLHAGAVGLTGAAAGAGAIFIVGKFTAGGAGAGAVGGAGVGAVPGAVIGFIVGVGVAAVAMWGADKLIPGSDEEWHAKQEAKERERRRREAEEALKRPLMEFGSSQMPLPFRPAPDMSREEQMAIANWFILQIRLNQQSSAGPYDPAQLLCDPNYHGPQMCIDEPYSR
ncbi:MAG: hypothetical protein JSS43_17945, partial [Proteobacteria bacterium]|nr:hypothetical protein [Pseudomonadota bacterium]